MGQRTSSAAHLSETYFSIEECKFLFADTFQPNKLIILVLIN